MVRLMAPADVAKGLPLKVLSQITALKAAAEAAAW